MPAEERNQNIEELRRRLEEMETVIAALRDGSADAMVADTGLVWFTGSERPYRAFFEAMNEGGLSLDETGRILHCNPCFAAMAEDTVGGLRGRHFIDFVAPDDRVHITDYLAGGKPGIIDATLLPASRMARPVQLSFTTMGNEGQQLFCVVVTDLRERAANTAAMQALNKKLLDTQFAMNSLGIGIHWVDAYTGRILEANRFAEEMLG